MEGRYHTTQSCASLQKSDAAGRIELDESMCGCQPRDTPPDDSNLARLWLAIVSHKWNTYIGLRPSVGVSPAAFRFTQTNHYIRRTGGKKASFQTNYGITKPPFILCAV
jgi:hypothetical protein